MGCAGGLDIGKERRVRDSSKGGLADEKVGRMEQRQGEH